MLFIFNSQLPNKEGGTEHWTTRSFSFRHSSSHSKAQLPDGSIEERSDTTDTEGNKV